MKTSLMCEIIQKTALPGDLCDLTLHAPAIAQAAQPGQFVHVLCGGTAFLRRPISICEISGKAIRIIFAIKGEGTKWLGKAQIGDSIDILGPLGRGYDPSKRGNGTALLIGGGIGIFPLLELAKHLGNGDTQAILGFRTRDLVVLEKDFTDATNRLHIATDDGSYGKKGFVTDILADLMAKEKITSIYACGPTPMLKAVKKMAEESGVYCQISLEERMGCGVGACMTCVCKTANGVYAPVCKNGPVFASTEVVFDA